MIKRYVSFIQYLLRLQYPDLYLSAQEKREHTGNILFIDSSAHFEKVKTQNVLRPEDIEKLITTYRERSEEEEPVDLTAVAKELRTLDMEMKDTDKEIAGFCTELGIEAPFKG